MNVDFQAGDDLGLQLHLSAELDTEADYDSSSSASTITAVESQSLIDSAGTVDLELISRDPHCRFLAPEFAKLLPSALKQKYCQPRLSSSRTDTNISGNPFL